MSPWSVHFAALIHVAGGQKAFRLGVHGEFHVHEFRKQGQRIRCFNFTSMLEWSLKRAAVRVAGEADPSVGDPHPEVPRRPSRQTENSGDTALYLGSVDELLVLECTQEPMNCTLVHADPFGNLSRGQSELIVAETQEDV